MDNNNNYILVLKIKELSHNGNNHHRNTNKHCVISHTVDLGQRWPSPYKHLGGGLTNLFSTVHYND